LLASVIALSLAALGIASCATEPGAPTSPTQVSTIGSANVVGEYWITLADEHEPLPPAPAPEPTEPAPAPAPPPPAGEGGNTGSWPPGPPPTAAPGVPVPTPPSTHMRMSVRIDPEPVHHSGQPITDSAYCRSNLPRYTWYYDQRISTDTGVPVTITERENFFDGRFVSRNTQTIVIPGNNGVILHTRWCSGVNAFHYAQTRFKAHAEGGEQFTLSGPWVRLYKP
jgi:hypothetical protein